MQHPLRILTLSYTICLLLFGATPCSMASEPLASMVAQAEAIVIATPLYKNSYWENGVIKTRAVLEVKEVITGEIPEKRISITYDGGIVGSIGLKVSHGVRLPADQKAILFLKQAGESFTVLNQIQGVFYILPSEDGEIVVRGSAYTPSPGFIIKSSRYLAPQNEGVPLKVFLSKLRKLKTGHTQP